MLRKRMHSILSIGVVFRNRPGTDKETYLAFKSGPNRGHYHGDQLSLHYCADARQVAIAAGATGDQVPVVAARLVAEGKVRLDRAQEILAEMAPG